MRYEETIGISSVLSQAEHMLSQRIEQAIRHLGITLPQYSTLSAIESNKNLTNADLARKCYVTPQTMNRILQNLLKLNLVKKSAIPQNSNKLVFDLSPKAVKLVCDAHVAVNEVETKMIKGLNKKEFAELERLIQLFIKNLT